TMVCHFATLRQTTDSLGTRTDGNDMPVPGGLIDATLMTIGTHEYTYTVIGTPPCGDATATVTVDVGAGLNAGIGGNDTICGGFTAYDLFGSLGGSPDLGGVWSEQTGVGAITGHFLDATALVPGSSYPLVYTLDDPDCGQVQSVVLMYISPFPDPGPDTTLMICSTASPVSLETRLTGADHGGGWVGPNPLPTDPLVDPTVDRERS